MAAKDTQPAYRYLAGTRGFIEFERQTLWLAPDHLLSVSTAWARETNRKFPLTEIEGITIQGTTLGRFLTITFLAAVVAGFGVGAMYYGRGGTENEVLGTVGFIVGGAGLAALLINLALGPTSVSHLYTSVHVEKLKPLRRLRRARRFVREAVPAVNRTQGALPKTQATALANNPGRLTLAAHARTLGQTSRKPLGLGAHRVLAVYLIVAGLVAIPNVAVFFSAKVTIDFFVFGAALLAAVVAGIRQVSASLPRSVRMLPWMTFVLAGIGAVIASYHMSIEWAEATGPDQLFSLIDVHRMISAMIGLILLAIGAGGWLEVTQLERKLRFVNRSRFSEAGITKES